MSVGEIAMSVLCLAILVAWAIKTFEWDAKFTKLREAYYTEQSAKESSQVAAKTWSDRTEKLTEDLAQASREYEAQGRELDELRRNGGTDRSLMERLHLRLSEAESNNDDLRALLTAEREDRAVAESRANAAEAQLRDVVAGLAALLHAVPDEVVDAALALAVSKGADA